METGPKAIREYIFSVLFRQFNRYREEKIVNV